MATAKKTTTTKKKDAPEAEAPEAKAPVIAIPEGVHALTREDILGQKDVQQEWLEVPEWGGSILIRGLSGNGRDAFERDIHEGEGKDRHVQPIGIRAKLVAACAIDHVDGQQLFSPLDVQALGNKNGAALQSAFEVSGRLSGMGAKQREEMVQNLEPTPSGDSPSDSPSPSDEPEPSSLIESAR